MVLACGLRRAGSGGCHEGDHVGRVWRAGRVDGACRRETNAAEHVRAARRWDRWVALAGGVMECKAVQQKATDSDSAAG